MPLVKGVTRAKAPGLPNGRGAAVRSSRASLQSQLFGGPSNSNELPSSGAG